MGKKVNPLAMRIGAEKYKFNVWFTTQKKVFKKYVAMDYEIRKLGEKILNKLNFAQIGIERIGIQTNITIYTHKPGFIVGSRDGKLSLIEDYKKQLKEKVLPAHPFIVVINDQDIKAESSAIIISNNLAKAVEDRVSYKSVTKKAISNFMRLYPEGGIKVIWKGRVNGAEIARTDKFQDGKMPQSTIKSDIQFAYSVAHTSVGTVTCRVYIFLPPQELRSERRRFEKNDHNNFRRPFENRDRGDNKRQFTPRHRNFAASSTTNVLKPDSSLRTERVSEKVTEQTVEKMNNKENA